MSKASKRVIFGVIAVLFVAAVAFASVYDYDISKNIAAVSELDEPLWTLILDVMGEMPALLFSGFNMVVIVEYYKRKKEHKNRGVILAISYILLVVCGFYPMFKLMKTLALHEVITFGSSLMKYAVYAASGIIVGLIVGFIFLKITSKYSDEKVSNYKNAALTCIGIAVSVLVIINMLKMGFGRPRPWAVFGENVAFSSWYQPHFFSGYRSFPSGHTANATMIIMLAVYFPKKRKWLVPLLSLWIIAVAVSRLFAGAHFLSDVLFGCFFTLLICYIWCRKTGAWHSVKD